MDTKIEAVPVWFFNAVMEYWTRKYGYPSVTVVKALYAEMLTAPGNHCAINVAEKVADRLYA